MAYRARLGEFDTTSPELLICRWQSSVVRNTVPAKAHRDDLHHLLWSPRSSLVAGTHQHDRHIVLARGADGNHRKPISGSVTSWRTPCPPSQSSRSKQLVGHAPNLALAIFNMRPRLRSLRCPSSPRVLS